MLIYLTNPLALQGALSVDFTDGNLLPLALTFFLFMLSLSSNWAVQRRMIALGLCLWLSLWAKLTTPTILIIAMFIAALIADKKRESLKLFTGVVVIGSLMFILTWGAYCFHLRMSLPEPSPSLMEMMVMPIDYLTSGEASGGPMALTPFLFFLGVLRFVLYTGPLFLLLSLPPILRWGIVSIRELRLHEDGVMFLLIVGIISGYSVFQGGGSGPFPKYYAPAIPLLAVACAGYLMGSGERSPGRSGEVSSRRDKRMRVRWAERPPMGKVPKLATLAILMIAYHIFMVGDPIYLFNHDLRVASYQGDPGPAKAKLLLVEIIYFVPLIALLIWRKHPLLRPTLKPLLLTLLISYQAAQCLIQGLSPYAVRYYYGTPSAHIEEVKGKIQSIGEQPAILATGYFVYTAGAREVPGYHPGIWDDPARLKELIGRARPDALLYGLPTNTIRQVRSINESRELQSLLRERYTEERIGEFWLWLEKGKPQRSER